MEQGFDNSSFEVWWYKLEASEVLMLVIIGRRTSRFLYCNFMGMGSKSHDLGTVFWDQNPMIWGQSFEGFPKKLFSGWCECL